MKWRASLVASLVVAVLLTACTSSQTGIEEARLVSVTGEAEVRVVPDEVVLTLGVETWDKDMATAKDRNDAIVARAIAAAEACGVKPEHIQTDYIGIEPRYRDSDYEQRDFIGFFVHKNLVITLRDLAKFEALLTDVLKAGVNYVQRIEFRSTELRKHRDEARALAARAAREKATALARELGQSIARPRTIQEEQSGWWSGYGSWWGFRWGSAMSQNVTQEYAGTPLSVDASVAPGQISIRASVSVTFELSD